MQTTTSKDGTTIAYDRSGDGPPLTLVDGALCYRASGPSGPLAERLADEFTVFTYDRPGRGDSGDTAPYAVEREVEDIEALIEEAGGSASLYGISSGAVLALEAANPGLSVDTLALYEPPFIVDDSRAPVPADYLDQLNATPRPADRWSAATVPALVIGGGKSPRWMRNSAQALAAILSHAEYTTLEGQTHMVKAKAIAPMLAELFADRQAPAPRVV